MDVTEEDLQNLYTWVDEIPLSRPKRNIARDFADGVLLAEVVAHYFPKLVELHNYSAANGMQQKLYNWNTLNNKVLKKLGMQLTKQHMSDIANVSPGAIERALKLLKIRLAGCTEESLAAGSPLSGKVSPHGSVMPPGALQADLWQPGAVISSGAKQQSSISISSEVLVEKERTIAELKETNEILETKVRKLEQLVKLKDAKIQTLVAKLQAAGLA